MKKIKEFNEIKHLFKDGMTIMVGGFLVNGSPEKLIDYLVEMNIKDITLIANDTGFIDRGIGKLVVNNQVKKVIASHIGTNKVTGKMMNEGNLNVELVPQGTLAERIRAGGSGLGGILTQTGIGTIVEEGKQKMTIEDTEFLIELPLRADIALLKGSITDEFGNTFYKGTTQNFNPLMAFAADIVVMETEEIVKNGELQPELAITPGILVDYVVYGGK